MKKATHRFGYLDALRGIAAIAVMGFHFFRDNSSGVLGHSYLAVDFFFILSGFVISHTYDAKFEKDMSVKEFLLVRIIRLYPLPVVAVFSVVVLQLLYHPSYGLLDLAYKALMNAALVPTSLNTSVEKFPIVPPTWSLFYELSVNIMYALFFSILGKRVLYSILLVLSVILCAVINSHGSVELIQNNVSLGFVRTATSFLIGVILRRYLKRPMVNSAWIVTAVTILFVFDIVSPTGIINSALFDVLSIFVLFPIVVHFSSFPVYSYYSGLCYELGDLSYPVYVLHMPAAAYAGIALGWLLRGSLMPLAASIITLALSYLAVRFYDRPIRVWLKTRLSDVK